MEQLLHYTWKHRLLGTKDLQTVDGQQVEIIDPGLHNTNAGPDFFNAKVKIGGQLFVGNVEIHLRASDWNAHHHDQDSAYNNVILHVVEQSDRLCVTQNGRQLPQLVVSIPPTIVQQYEQLRQTDHYPPCYRAIPDIPPLTVHAWLSALQTERLERKTTDIICRLHQCDDSWEQAWFVTLARAFGFGINADAMEQWALSIPLNQLAHHRDNLFQIEAVFYGQAGLLTVENLPPHQQADARKDAYYEQLQKEYTYLRHKLNLQLVEKLPWYYLRLRPQNFPTIRMSQLAWLYYSNKANLSQVISSDDEKYLRQTLRTQATPYFQKHYLFGSACPYASHLLSRDSVSLIFINTLIPMLFAYGRHRHDESLVDRAFQFLERLPAEDNHIVRMWRECGLKVDTAADTQALIQLKNEYCDRRDCLRCRFAYEVLRTGEGGMRRKE